MKSYFRRSPPWEKKSWETVGQTNILLAKH